MDSHCPRAGDGGDPPISLGTLLEEVAGELLAGRIRSGSAVSNLHLTSLAIDNRAVIHATDDHRAVAWVDSPGLAQGGTSRTGPRPRRAIGSV